MASTKIISSFIADQISVVIARMARGEEKSTMDIASPYFLTAADHPGQNFVGENLLRDGNYYNWEREMKNALFAKNKIGFVDGTLPMPKEGSSDLMIWKRCNAMVTGWLVSAMEKEIKSSVKYATTARDIWLDLKERFGKENAARAYELRRTITTIRQQNMTVSAYYTKLRGVWDEIQSISPTLACTCKGCTCEITKEITKARDKERLYDFLMGLNEEYEAVKAQILNRNPPLSLAAAYHLVSQDEQQRQIRASRKTVLETAAFQSSGKPPLRLPGKTYTQPSNKKDERWRDGKNDDRLCTHCHKSGHSIERCFELVGYPEWWPGKAATSKNQSGKPRPQPRAAAVNGDTSTLNLVREEYEKFLQSNKHKRAGSSAPNGQHDPQRPT